MEHGIWVKYLVSCLPDWLKHVSRLFFSLIISGEEGKICSLWAGLNMPLLVLLQHHQVIGSRSCLDVMETMEPNLS